MASSAHTVAGLTAQQQELLRLRLEKLRKNKSEGASSSRRIPRWETRLENLPLSFAQHRLWFLDQLEPGNAAYNISLALRLEGELDRQALHDSINHTVRRHESLRTCFVAGNGEPRQVIVHLDGIELPVIDLRSCPEEQRREKARMLAEEEALTPFDLRQAPLVRVKLLVISEQEHLLLISMQHIISDGWSVPIIAREITECYKAYLAGDRPQMPELPIQYADYALWQNEELKGARLEQHLDYWRKQLANVSELDLPVDHARGATTSHRAGGTRFQLSAETTAKLKDLGRSENATPFMVLMAAFQFLLGWYAKRTDIAVGTDIANRVHGETEGLIGFFVNQLVIRTNIAASRTFQELLRKVRETSLQAYNHQDLPFEKLIEILMPERTVNRSPLVEVKLVVLNMPHAQQAETSGLRVSTEPTAPPAAKFDLLLTAWEYESRLRAAIEYRADLFEPRTIELLSARFQEVLSAVAEQPEIVLKDLKEKLENSQQLALRNILSRKLSSIRRKQTSLTHS